MTRWGGWPWGGRGGRRLCEFIRGYQLLPGFFIKQLARPLCEFILKWSERQNDFTHNFWKRTFHSAYSA